MASMDPPISKSSYSINRRDQSWLLPSNRKVRNLVSISLRNLSFESRSSGRTRGKTIDDDAVPQTLQSPAKMVAQRELKTLEHSRSEENLKALASPTSKSKGKSSNAITTASTASDDTIGAELNGAPTRPHMHRIRRRSTLEWANATPQRRQEQLERVTHDRLADVFFSLHVHAFEEPIYVSETIERTMNPTFRNIDLSACGPGVTRLGRVILRVWARHAKPSGQWRQLMELDIALERMQYLGKSLDQLSYPLSQNAVVFHLPDGIYTIFTNFIPPPSANSPAPARANSTRARPTSSFDVLLRLSKLDDSIQDALATRNKLAADLEGLLEANRDALDDQDQVAEAEDRLKTIDYAKKTIEKQVEKARKQAQERRESLATRRALMQADISARRSLDQQIQQSQPEIPLSRDEREVKQRAIQNQRRRICEDLQKIYPVVPIPGKSLAFTIRGLHLPNSDDLDGENPDTLAAALGFIAHLLLLLSFYLQHPLPYPAKIRGSSSTITDPISLLKSPGTGAGAGSSSAAGERHLITTNNNKDKNRIYPLFPRGAPRFRFEYAVFLLNKDVQLLLESAFNVRVLDVRHTLPNLKYLLYVATAGEGELPARKAGGVRGLARARRAGGLGGGAGERMERSGSEDSMASTLVGSVLSGSAGGGAGGKQVNGKPKPAALESLKKNIGPGKR